MKKSVVIGIFALIALNIGVYAVSYAHTYREMRQSEAEEIQNAVNVAEASVPQEVITSADTEYVIERCDIDSGAVEQEIQERLPVAYIACTREEIVSELKAYAEEPSLEDLEAGFTDCSLASFSAERVVVRKDYSSMKAGYKYCVIAEHGMLTVYYVDKKTVYEYTTIPAAALPESVQEEVADGKYFENAEQLFAFLESYSS